MKLNCDMGEGFGRYSFGVDNKIMPHIHMANIACGFHAGDPEIMERTIKMAVEQGVEIGAHPSYPDLQGFGRRKMDVSPEDVRRLILYQAGALDAFCHTANGQLSYIKPHGALYNTMMGKEEIMRAIFQAVSDYSNEHPSKIKLMIQATANWQYHKELAAQYGVELYLEAFADRAYEEDGTLRNRKYDDALLDASGVLEQVSLLCQKGKIKAITGTYLEFPVDSLCVHGDSPSGINQIAELRKLLETYID